LSGKESPSDRACEEPEHDEVVHLKEIATRDANHVFVFGVSLAARRLAGGFHSPSFEWAISFGGDSQAYEVSPFCQ
jgi:hypothetical protein